ncbi:MAG: hypothetical protein CMF25_07225 [Kangiellaceae bacterium]|nr:hypothetical protein [Kangiellaceae bacterium]|tara:strand:+ start:565 stop:1776 length:1212 start_codon:yes stop_codon:yes gene_type:complete
MSQLKTTPASKKKTPNNYPKTPQELFRSRWNAIEKAQRSLERKKKERQVLVERFNSEILPLEQELSQAKYQLIEHLIPFYGRKSLSAAYKQDLLEWIEEVRDELLNSPFRSELDIEKLFLKVHQAINEQEQTTQEDVEQVRHSIKHDFGIDKDFSDEEIEEFISNPFKFKEWLQKNSHQYNQRKASEDSQDYNSTYHSYQNEQREEYESTAGEHEDFDEASTNHHTINNLSKGFINRCYKKLAHVFHPDRASEDFRDEAHGLMIKLSKAKKDQDVFTILSLYQHYVDDGDFSFSDSDINELNVLLKDKLRQIEREEGELRWGEGIEAWIFKRFKGRSKKATNEHFAEYEHAIDKDIIGMNELISEITSLKTLRPILQERSMFRNYYSIPSDFEEALGELFSFR